MTLTRERRAEYDDGSIVVTALDQNYAYDAAGNRLSRTGSGTGHEAMGAVGGHDMHNDMHQLEHFALGGLSHVRRATDDAGNTTRHWDTAGTPAFDWNTTWSADNRLTYAQNAVTGGKKVRYVYDWQGRRLQRTDETHAQAHVRTRYYFHGLTPLGERTSQREFDDVMGWGYWTWSTSRLNTLAPGQYGHVLVQRNGGTDRYLHYDHVGNVIAESSTAGTFAAQHEQDAFGRPVLSSASGGWSHNALHMTTKDYDADAGMFYFYQRWYDRNTGTFHAPDPFPRFFQHPHSFVSNRPTMMVDTDGRRHWLHGAGELFVAPGFVTHETIHIWNEDGDHATTPPDRIPSSDGVRSERHEVDFVQIGNTMIKIPDNAHVVLSGSPPVYNLNIREESVFGVEIVAGHVVVMYPCSGLPRGWPKCK